MRHPRIGSAGSLLAAACVVFFACQKDYNVQLDRPEFTSVTTLSRTAINLQGNVYDDKGQPASGASVTVGNLNVIADEKGYFRIEKAPVNGHAPMIAVEKTGYFKAFRSFRITSGTIQLVIQLTKKTAAGNIAAATGGEVALQNGSKIALAAGGVVNAATGMPYTGSVTVYASYIDPTSQDIGRTVPGSFMADDKNGERVVLESYGMLAVELESSSGEKLQVAPGKTATISSIIPPSLLSAAPATIPLWYVNEKTGVWQEEGTATRNGNTYTGSVSHFTFWNTDKPLKGVPLTATLKTFSNVPLPGTQIRLTSKGAVDVKGTVWTDSLGQLNELVPLGQSLLIEVLDPCNNVVYTEQLPVITGSTEKGTLRLAQNSKAVLTVKGKLYGCSAKAMDGFAVVALNNMVHYAAADAEGNFSTSFIACGNTNPVQVYGVDINAFQRGEKITLQAQTPVVDAGTVTACGTAIDEYVKYTLDGTTYNVADSINAGMLSPALWDSMANNTFNGTGGSFFSASGLSFFVMTGANESTGTYSLPAVTVHRVGSHRIANVSRADVHFTKFPKNPKEYFEGTLDFIFTDTSQQQHTLKGKFRMMRK